MHCIKELPRRPLKIHYRGVSKLASIDGKKNSRKGSDDKAECNAHMLHQLGNLLNGVFLVVEEIADMIDETSTARLSEAGRLLEEHRDRLIPFLTEDPQGKLLLEFYRNIGKVVDREQGAIRDEIAVLRKQLAKVRTCYQGRG